MWVSEGGSDRVIGAELKMELIKRALEMRGRSSKKVLVLPPDITRLHSGAGELTQMLYELLGDGTFHIMPAIGTHEPMTEDQVQAMYGNIPRDLFRIHDWRNDVVEIGVVPSGVVKDLSEGKLDFDIPVQINRALLDGDYDLIVSIGQVVPHEVIGMANYTKNVLVGIGGEEMINKSHFLSAVYGLERIMGRIETPVRKLLNWATKEFLSQIEIVYIMTVMGTDQNGDLVTRGLYIGNDDETFRHAAMLSQKVNITRLQKPLKKVVVYLDPREYQSHWLGNKAIYRTRMAIATGGELIIVAPGLKQYGEDPEIDSLIRKYGYHGTQTTLQAVKKNQDLRQNLAAAAHLIHGSSDGRFRIRYAPGNLSKEETERTGYEWADVGALLQRYDPEKLSEGFNSDMYFVRNPALGLWMA